MKPHTHALFVALLYLSMTIAAFWSAEVGLAILWGGVVAIAMRECWRARA